MVLTPFFRNIVVCTVHMEKELTFKFFWKSVCNVQSRLASFSAIQQCTITEDLIFTPLSSSVQGNYKRYRESLEMAQTPCVPYLGVVLKDLTFICDGNPDYLRGGLINLHKRRQVCMYVHVCCWICLPGVLMTPPAEWENLAVIKVPALWYWLKFKLGDVFAVLNDVIILNLAMFWWFTKLPKFLAMLL